jgi:hypothetical protein
MMDATKETVTTHTKAFDGLKHSIESISKMAVRDMDLLNFYDDNDGLK